MSAIRRLLIQKIATETGKAIADLERRYEGYSAVEIARQHRGRRARA